MSGVAAAGPVAGPLDEVLDLYRRFGAEQYDEELSQTEHGLQTAALARRDGASDELVAAALLHDVGHLLDMAAHDGERGSHDTDLDHEAVGARYLTGLFGAGVTGPIALHVRAKRYRCTVEAEYLAGLSAGSTASLALQGGPMSDDECRSFEENPGHRDAVALRGWDDGGKIDGLDVGTLDDYVPLLRSLLESA